MAPGGRWTKILKRVALLVGSTLFAFALAEAGLRAFLWTKGIGRSDIRRILEESKEANLPEFEDGEGLFGRMEPSPYQDVVYQLKPHLRGTLKGAHIETNSFGMRSPELERAKPDRTFRIAGLGDSHMFGWAVEQDELYMARLALLLNRYAEPGWRFELLNFGTPGYDTVMEVATFEHRALPFDPDLAVLHFVPNDLQPPHFLQVPRGLTPSRWYLVELLRAYLDEARKGETSADAKRRLNDPAERAAREAEFARWGGQEAMTGAMAKLAELTRARGVPVLVLELDTQDRVQKLARDEAKRHGFRFLSAAPSYAALTAEKGLKPGSSEFDSAFVRDGHPSPIGHEAYARALFCELQRMPIPHLRPAPEECRWESDPSAKRKLHLRTGVADRRSRERKERRANSEENGAPPLH